MNELLTFFVFLTFLRRSLFFLIHIFGFSLYFIFLFIFTLLYFVYNKYSLKNCSKIGSRNGGTGFGGFKSGDGGEDIPLASTSATDTSTSAPPSIYAGIGANRLTAFAASLDGNYQARLAA